MAQMIRPQPQLTQITEINVGIETKNVEPMLDVGIAQVGDISRFTWRKRAKSHAASVNEIVIAQWVKLIQNDEFRMDFMNVIIWDPNTCEI